MAHAPLQLFDDLDEFDFGRDKRGLGRLTSELPPGGEEVYEVEYILAKRELKPRVVEYQVRWMGFPNQRDYTWEPKWRLKADIPNMVRLYERRQQANR